MEKTENQDKPGEKKEKPEYTPPANSVKKLQGNIGGKMVEYQAEAGWIILRKDEKPNAEMFFTSYTVTEGPRPVTFVFNGGPGTSSVFLHLGAVGPRRVEFAKGGSTLPPPHKLTDNEDSWLAFTDLVFIDPIGTGFSRMIAGDSKDNVKKGEQEKKEIEYWGIKRDLESICEFVIKYLSKYNRWESPIFLAGESYGGFRVARLARLIQQDYGVPLKGAVIISPALEFCLLDGSDYDTLPWLDTFPTMAAAAAHHQKARQQKEGEPVKDYAGRAGDFAINELLPVLAGGELIEAKRKKRVLDTAADFIGLPRDLVNKRSGRIPIDYFVKNLLRDKGLICGLYDTSTTVKDPFPDRDDWEGPDPTLHVMERVFAAGINSQLRGVIGLETDRDYFLSSEEANINWKNDQKQHVLESQIGSTDELRYGMSVNPHMKVYLTHGIFDLVTPFFAADRISNLMKLDDDRKKMLTVKHYNGGHMFYTWEESRKAFSADMREFYFM